MKLLDIALVALVTVLAVSAHPHNTFPKQGTTIHRRFDEKSLASDELWEKAFCKGGKLVELMTDSDAEAGPKIEQTKNRKEPSARSDWQGDLKGMSEHISK